MYRAQPKASKLLSAKWQEKDHQIHLQKLQNIKSAIKVQKPHEFAHLKSKPKKNQMLEGKQEPQAPFSKAWAESGQTYYLAGD